MEKFIKEMGILFDNLNKSNGMSALVEINEIEILYKKHVTDLKKTHIKEFVSSLPSEKEADEYSGDAFGYDHHSFEQEKGFQSGHQWTIDHIKNRLGI